MDAKEIIRICMERHGKLGDFQTASAAIHQLSMLTTEKQDDLAREMSIDPVTLRGLTLLCGYACNAVDWLIYHGGSTTQADFNALISELQQRTDADSAMRHRLYFELLWGAQKVVQFVTWNGSE